MKGVGILYHPQLPAAVALSGELCAGLETMGRSPWQCSAWNEAEAKAHMPGTDLVISIGGDGTILRTARAVVPWPALILGVNLGRLGFLTEVSPQEIFTVLPDCLAGKGWIDERILLQAQLLPRGEEIPPPVPGPVTIYHALNDVVVARGAAPRVVSVHASINDQPLTTYRADGVIVATPTGSTGYSLSVGGPILHPQMREILLQPISSHLTLAAGLVLPPDTVVQLRVQTDNQAMMSVDGQVDIPLNNGEGVLVKRSPHTVRFWRRQPLSYFYSSLIQRLRT